MRLKFHEKNLLERVIMSAEMNQSSGNSSSKTEGTSGDRNGNGFGEYLVRSDSLFGSPNQSSEIVPSFNSWAIVHVDNSLFGHENKNGITLIVDGNRFIVDPQLFSAYPDTMLARMFCSNMKYALPNERGEFEIAHGISGTVFRAILDYYRCGVIWCPPVVTVKELREACDFLLIPFNVGTIKSHNLRKLLHEFSNDGAKFQFEMFLENVMVPLMASCAGRGDRECHIVILDDDDVIEWDEEYPPPAGQKFIKTIHSTEMYRFLKYLENRNVAKEVMEGRRLKKVCIGIEGYPTHKEKVKQRPDGKKDVIYDYVQRPFIHMSWENQEAKSRHVDFQVPCIKTKSVTNLAEAASDPSIDELPHRVPNIDDADETSESENDEARA